MPYESLQVVVGTAVIDPEFRHALLNGARRRVIQSFNLTHEETDAVMAIRAESLEQFAGQLDQWISQAQGKSALPVLVLPTRRVRIPFSRS